MDELDRRPFTTLFIPGNHENYTRLMSDEFPTAAWKGGAAKLIRSSILMLMRGEMYDIGKAEFLHLAAPVLMTFMMACWMCKIRNGNKKQSG